MKRTQAEMEDILIEIKNNLQGINNRVDKPRIKSMISNVRKKKAPD